MRILRRLRPADVSGADVTVVQDALHRSDRLDVASDREHESAAARLEAKRPFVGHRTC